MDHIATPVDQVSEVVSKAIMGESKAIMAGIQAGYRDFSIPAEAFLERIRKDHKWGLGSVTVGDLWRCYEKYSRRYLLYYTPGGELRIAATQGWKTARLKLTREQLEALFDGLMLEITSFAPGIRGLSVGGPWLG